jgi:hypothetical protein
MFENFMIKIEQNVVKMIRDYAEKYYEKKSKKVLT